MEKFDYKQQIKNFLEDKNNYSLLIYGSWGVGKTYLWKEVENEINPKTTHKENLWKKFKSNVNFFNHLIILISIIKQCVGIALISIVKYFNLCNYIENSNKQLKNIVYISLFGKEHYKEVLEEITLKAYKHNKILYFIRNITFWKLSIGVFLQLFIEKNVENIIVCLDDLERKSSKLDIKDILGLINNLKEQKCKIILISNIDEINKNNNDKENFNTYKEKCIDLEMQIKSKVEVISQILKEKSPEIRKEIIPSSVYKIENLRNLNKIIKAFKIFNKELQFSENLKQEKEYKDLFKFVFEKIIYKFENVNLLNPDEEKQGYIHIKHMSSSIIDGMIKDYMDSAYFIYDIRKEQFQKELRNYKLYVDLAKAKNLLQSSIKYTYKDYKNEFEKIFNSINEEQLIDFIYSFGYIDFIVLDKGYNFNESDKIIKIKKYCLEIAKTSPYGEEFIDMICNNNEILKKYYEELNINETSKKNWKKFF